MQKGTADRPLFVSLQTSPIVTLLRHRQRREMVSTSSVPALGAHSRANRLSFSCFPQLVAEQNLLTQ